MSQCPMKGANLGLNIHDKIPNNDASGRKVQRKPYNAMILPRSEKVSPFCEKNQRQATAPGEKKNAKNFYHANKWEEEEEEEKPRG